MTITISLEGGQKVAASFPDGLRMLTDQPGEDGSPGAAPSPFACFLASIGTCAGFYVLEFCKARQIATDNISLSQQIGFGLDEQGKRRVDKVELTINLPAEFPERYRKAVVKAAEACTVKKAIMHPPEFVITSQTI